MSCKRTEEGEEARRGRSWFRRLAFSSSGMFLFWGVSSLELHALLVRFLR